MKMCGSYLEVENMFCGHGPAAVMTGKSKGSAGFKRLKETLHMNCCITIFWFDY